MGIMWEFLVHSCTQLFAWLEVGYVFGRKRNRLPRLGIATEARGTEVHGKTAEATDFDAFAVCKGHRNVFQDGFDTEIHVRSG